MELFSILLSLATLVILETILGIDNLILLTVFIDKLPAKLREKGRRYGLTFAWVARLILLALASYLNKLTKPFFYFNDLNFSVRDVFLILGGLFLITKATQEIHNEVKLKGIVKISRRPLSKLSFYLILSQLALLDIVFSLDSVLTAVGLTKHFWIMATAITIAILIMVYAAVPVSKFIAKYPTLKMLAFSFLMLIGMTLVADGFSFYIPREYLYFAMTFSLSVETLNIIRAKRKKKR